MAGDSKFAIDYDGGGADEQSGTSSGDDGNCSRERATTTSASAASTAADEREERRSDALTKHPRFDAPAGRTNVDGRSLMVGCWVSFPGALFAAVTIPGGHHPKGHRSRGITIPWIIIPGAAISGERLAVILTILDHTLGLALGNSEPSDIWVSGHYFWGHHSGGHRSRGPPFPGGRLSVILTSLIIR